MIVVPATPTITGQGPFTATCWIRTLDIGSFEQPRVILGLEARPVTACGIETTDQNVTPFALSVTEDGRLRYGYENDCGGAGGGLVADALGSLKGCGWHFVAVVRTASEHVTLYVDGDLQEFPNANADIAAYADNRLCFGSLLQFQEGSGPTTTLPLDGQLDEITYWNRDLSGSEVEALLGGTLPSSTAGLAGYWKLDDATGQVVLDHSGNGLHGTLGLDTAAAADDPMWVSVGPLPHDETTILTGAPVEIAVGSGGAQSLMLESCGNGFSTIYAILGSTTGTTGTPVGGTVLPLTVDAYFLQTATQLGALPSAIVIEDALGGLDAQGRAHAAVVVPPLSPAFVGLTINHAALIFEIDLLAGTIAVLDASNPVAMHLIL
ncbi:MAG: LamG-like jellyroll fold domain-containing protein [Cyanobacteria bacterium J06648_11]